jgi:hypothetical protein
MKKPAPQERDDVFADARKLIAANNNMAFAARNQAFGPTPRWAKNGRGRRRSPAIWLALLVTFALPDPQFKMELEVGGGAPEQRLDPKPSRPPQWRKFRRPQRPDERTLRCAVDAIPSAVPPHRNHPRLCRHAARNNVEDRAAAPSKRVF